MKKQFIALAVTAALILSLMGCAAPAPESESASPETASAPESESAPLETASAPESESAPPETASDPESESTPPEAASDPEPEEKDLSRYYIEDEGQDKTTDREAADALYRYLEETLSPQDYGWLYWMESSAPWMGEDAESGADIPKDEYWIAVAAPDRAPIDAALRRYDGPWAPVLFEQNDITLADTAQAEQDIKAFLTEHPEIKVLEFENSETQIYMVVEEFPDELRDFRDQYPIQGIYFFRKGGVENPD